MSDLPIPDPDEQPTPNWLSAVLGAEVTGAEYTVLTDGLVSKTFRASVTYAETPVDLPRSLIIKLPHADPAIRARLEPRGLYLREASFYRDIAPSLGDAAPRCFHADHDPVSGRSVIVLEDGLEHDGWRVGDNVEGCSPEEAAGAMRALAAWHARLWNRPELAQLAWLRTHANINPTLPEDLADLWNTYPPEIRQLMDRGLIETIDLLCSRVKLTVERTSREPWTLTHSDYRLDNLLLGPDEAVRVFDWQVLSRGQGARDATYFATWSPVRGTSLEQAWQPLMDAYYNALRDAGVEYSHHAFASDVRVNALHGIWQGLFTFGWLDTEGERAQQLMSSTVDRWNTLAEMLDFPRFLREEFPVQ